MSDRLKALDVVALTEDLPQHGLPRGQVGTVVEELAGDTFEVEFADDAGRPYLIVPMAGRQLIRLRYARPSSPDRPRRAAKRPGESLGPL
ncbi:MAG: DUF4926 domain-containing protein [Candidatus Rokuibacteriota bacterium]